MRSVHQKKFVKRLLKQEHRPTALHETANKTRNLIENKKIEQYSLYIKYNTQLSVKKSEYEKQLKTFGQISFVDSPLEKTKIRHTEMSRKYHVYVCLYIMFLYTIHTRLSFISWPTAMV